MAEPQVNTDIEKTPTRDNSKGSAERRAFAETESQSRQIGQAAESAANIGRAVTEGGRQVAERGLLVGRDVAEAWSRSFDPFMAMQLDMNRWVDDFWRQTTGLGVLAPLRTARPLASMGAASLFGLPPADLRETEKAYELAVELPGLAREDIDIALHHDTLNVSGHKSEESANATAAYRVSERRFGRFARTFPIPEDVNREAIDASFKDGVLRVVLPKSAESAGHTAKIHIKG